MSWYEEDPAKRSRSFAAFLANLPLPEPRAERGAGGLDDPRGRAEGDLYRMALQGLVQGASPEAAKLLAELVENRAAPSDVRLTALRGLGRQGEEAALRALQGALQDPDPKIREAADLGLKRLQPPATGFLVTSVFNDSQGSRLGLRPGSIITRYNDQPIRDVGELQQAIRAAQGKSVPVQVFQGGALQTMTLNGGERIGIDGEGVSAAE